jgi:glycosyltransferase involved in cell wall biosynthesis
MGHYHRADLLVFPTLCDGFGLVATEAWSTGLPVLTTSRAGVADMLRPGVNGLLMRHGDPGTLAETLTWCLENRPALRAMRSGARASAAAWQWSDYRLALRQHVLQALAACASR